MRDVKEINIKNRTYYFFDNMTNTKDFDPNLQKIDKKSYKNIDIYYIGYITEKDSYYVKVSINCVNSVNPLYLNISEADGYIKEKNRSKYLVFDLANENNEVLKKYNKPWDVIKNEIETINSLKASESHKDFMKMKFSSDDNKPLYKILKPHKMTIVISSVSKGHCQFYPQVYLDECLYELV